jgi:hypothetical protein
LKGPRISGFSLNKIITVSALVVSFFMGTSCSVLFKHNLKGPEAKADRASENKEKTPDRRNVESPEKDGKIDKENAPKSLSSETSGSGGEKHNHSSYLQKIRKSAEEFAKTLKDADFVRLCRDREEWSLTAYYLGAKDYRFTSYAWDEIDQTWEKSLSDKQPIKGLKNHLHFSASGKECNILKGSEPLK